MSESSSSSSCGQLASSTKQSGLKPPAKISRPCSVAPKPALPAAATPRANGAASSAVRKGSVDVPKKKSIDASVVLTEDTDSFIIGDKVWVGGSKPGQIAYIGETQFAPGEWAGVVLDEPVGKNDGSVAGVRYFQCEPRRGVFSRLTRLTRSPLSPSEIAQKNNGVSSTISSAVSTPTRRLTLALSPAGSVKELQLKKTFTPATSQILVNADLKLGERVIVMSSQGSKPGTLRYMGTAEFAPGQWCGVELDDPLGKNDGSVEGVRYFECQPKFGLFAPIHKVSKSPSSRRPSCQLHHGPGAVLNKAGSRESLTSTKSAASSVTGTRVRLGVTSLNKSMQRSVVRSPISATTARTLQDALKEKEDYVAKLLKERDLERAEVTRAASQADDAEQKLAKFQKEFEEYKNASDRKIEDLQRTVERLEAERKELYSQLEDEKRRIEDIQFRFEEESIIKSDLEVANTALLKQIQELEENLAEERHKSELLERDSNKLFETEEALARTREDFETLRKDLDSALSEMKAKSSTIDFDKQKSGEEMERLQQSLSDLQVALKAKMEEADNNNKAYETELMILRSEAQETENQLNQQLENAEKQHSEELQALQNKLKDLQSAQEISAQGVESIVKDRDSEINALKERLDDNIKLLHLKSDELVQKTEAFKHAEELMQKEISEMKTAFLDKSEALEKALSELQKKDNEMSYLKLELTEVEKSLADLTEELNRKVMEMYNFQCVSKDNMEELGGLLKQKTDELAKNNKEHANKMEKAVETISELQKQLEDERVLVTSRKLEVENLQAELVRTSESLNQNFSKQLQEKDVQLQELQAKLLDFEGMLATNKCECTKHLETLQRKEAELSAEQEKTLSLSEKLNSSTQANETLSTEIQNSRFEVGELQRKLQASDEKASRIMQQKQKLEDDISTLMDSSTDSSTQLSKLNVELKEHVRQLDMIREHAPLAKQTVARLRHVLVQSRQQWAKSTQEVQQQMLQVASYVQKVLDENRSRQEEQKHLEEMMKAEIQELKIGHEKSMLEMQGKLEEKTCENAKLISEWEQKQQLNESLIQDLNAQLNQTAEQSRTMENEQRSEVEHLRKMLEAAETEIKTKSELLVSTEHELKSKIKQLAEENEKIQQQKTKEVELKIQSLQDELTAAKCAIENNDKELASTLEKLAALQQEIIDREKVIKERDEKLTVASTEITELGKMKADLETVVQNKAEKLSELTTNIGELQNVSTCLQKEKEDALSKLVIVNEQLTELQEDKTLTEKLLSEQVMKLSELTKSIATVQEEKNTNETAVKEKDSRLVSLTEELEKIQREKTDFENLLKEEHNKAEGVSAELVTLRKEKSEMEKLVSERDGKIATILQEVERLKHEIGRLQDEVKLQLESTKQEEEFAKDVRTKLESEKVRIDKLEEKLHSTEEERDELKKRCELLMLSSQKNTELTAELSSLQKQLSDSILRERDLKQKSEMEVLNLEKSLKEAKILLSEKEKEISLKGKQVSEPIVQKTKDDVQLKKLLEKNGKKDVTRLQNPDAQEVSNPSSNGATSEKLVEEKEFAESQVNFLNSVIVDLQRKNEELKARVEILELGVPAADVDAYNLNGLKNETAPPRMFCDICDMFDQHDTEDCPRQANESPPPQPRVRTKKKQVEERPYCEICEMFGHDTAVCDDAETF